MVPDQDLAGANDIARLGPEQPDGADEFGKARFAQRDDAFGRAVLREEFSGGQVDRLVGRLRREGHRHK